MAAGFAAPCVLSAVTGEAVMEVFVAAGIWLNLRVLVVQHTGVLGD